MGDLSNYAETKLLDHVLKNTAFNRPSNLYLALCTAAPVDTDTGSTITEVSGGSYARQFCDSWDVAASRATANSVLITYPEATAAWGTVTHFAICDALSAGNVLAYGIVSPNKIINNGTTATIAIGDLDISWDAGGISDYLANELLDHVFPDAVFAQPSSIFVLLTTASISDSDAGSTVTEPTGSNYARIQHDNYDAASLGVSENTGIVTFIQATTGWGTITNIGLVDSLTNGNLLMHCPVSLSPLPNVGDGDQAKIADGGLDITFD